MPLTDPTPREANVRREPTASDYKLRLSVPDGRHGHHPVTLFNRNYVGTWRGEIGGGVSAEVTRVSGQWQLVLRRGDQSAAFAPVTVNVSPFEACFFVEHGWFAGGAEMAFLTY